MRKDVYTSEEWKKIEPMARVHMILVAEHVKPGATFGTFSRNISEILDELKVYYHIRLETERFPLSKFYAVNISNSQKNIDSIVKLLSGELKTDVHLIWGKFYGYPDCCITKFSTEAKMEKDSEKRFILQLLELKEAGKDLPKELLYLMPTQTPCSPSCKKTLRMLNIWKQTLKKVDEEVADWLVKWNEEELKRKIMLVEREIRRL